MIMDLFSIFDKLSSSLTISICWTYCLFFQCVSSILIKFEIFRGVWSHVWVLSFLFFFFFHLSTCFPFVLLPRCFYDYISVVQLEIENSDNSQSSFGVKDCFNDTIFLSASVWSL